MGDKNIDDKLNQTLDVQPVKVHEVTEVHEGDLEYVDISKERETDIQDDYDFRRETLYQLIGTGKDAMDNLLQLAKESDHPRAYEVFGQLLRSNADLVKELTQLQIEMNKIENEKDGKGPNKVVNNNSVFVGNTNELLEMLKGKNRE